MDEQVSKSESYRRKLPLLQHTLRFCQQQRCPYLPMSSVIASCTKQLAANHLYMSANVDLVGNEIELLPDTQILLNEL